MVNTTTIKEKIKMKRLNRKMNESSSDQDIAMNLLDTVYNYGNLCRKVAFNKEIRDHIYVDLQEEAEELYDNIVENQVPRLYVQLRLRDPNFEAKFDDKADFLDCLSDIVKEYGNTCRAFGLMQGRNQPASGLQRKKREMFEDIIELVSVSKDTGKIEFDESGSEEGETEWFDKMGDMKKNLPMDCILGCSGSGRVDDEVDYWVNELNFQVPIKMGLSYLRECGLDDIVPEDVDKYVLWIMCGNIKDQAYEFSRDGSEWDYVDKDSYPDDIDDWGEEDWERFQDEVAIRHLGM